MNRRVETRKTELLTLGRARKAILWSIPDLKRKKERKKERIVSRSVFSVEMNLYWQLSRDGNLHGSGISHATTASPNPSFRASWRVGDAVVGRWNAGLTTSKDGHSLHTQELLTRASRWKDWKRISAESSLMSPRRPNRSWDCTELNWTKSQQRGPTFLRLRCTNSGAGHCSFKTTYNNRTQSKFPHSALYIVSRLRGRGRREIITPKYPSWNTVAISIFPTAVSVDRTGQRSYRKIVAYKSAPGIFCRLPWRYFTTKQWRACS